MKLNKIYWKNTDSFGEGRPIEPYTGPLEQTLLVPHYGPLVPPFSLDTVVVTCFPQV